MSRQQRQLQRAELMNKQLKEELETKSSQQSSRAAKATDHQQEINKLVGKFPLYKWIYLFDHRLEQRLKEVEIDHQEAISALHSKQETEMIRLKGLLANSETMQTEVQREVNYWWV